MNTAPVVGCQCFLPLFCHFFPTQILGPSAESDESDKSDDYVVGHNDYVGGHDDHIGGHSDSVGGHDGYCGGHDDSVGGHDDVNVV